MSHRIENLTGSGSDAGYELADGTKYWVPALPLSYPGFRGFLKRLSDAWMVACGNAEAVVWPHQRNDE